MAHLWQGIQLGLLLAILVGPLLVTLIQASLEQGMRSGFMVAGGIWISDIAFILAIYFGMPQVIELIKWPHFELTLGLVGAVVLLVVGIATILKPPPDLNANSGELNRYESYFSLATKGFLINTLNPFTVFFWMSVMTGVVMEQDLSSYHALLFFGGIMGMIFFTDSLKIALAEKIKHRLKSHHFQWVRGIAGGALIVFAVVLAVRVMI